MGAFLFRLARIIGLTLLATLFAFVVVVSLGIRVDLEALREPFAALASRSLGRPVSLAGEIFLVPSWSLTIEAHGLEIGNPPGFDAAPFARLERARLQVGLLPLLRRRLVIRELSARGAELELERSASGAVNWEFAADAAAADPTPEAGETLASLWLPTAIRVERLELQDVRARLRDAARGSERSYVLEDLSGSAATDAPLELDLRGTWDERDFSIALRAGDPTHLVGGEEPWPLGWHLELVGARLSIEAQVDEHDWTIEDLVALVLDGTRQPLAGLAGRRLGEVSIQIEAERLDRVGELAELSLPRWGPLRIGARAEAFEGGRLGADIEIQVGSSRLSGRLELDTEAEPPRLDLTLAAPGIQLDDFRLDGWSATRGAPAADGDPVQPDHALLDSQVLRALDGVLDVRVGRVASGRDRLGAGRLRARLRGGRLRIDPLEVDVPGGSLRTRASLAPQAGGRVTAGLEIRVERFDYGILARRLAPDTTMAGLFAMDAELRSAAASAGELPLHARGRFDFAVFPERLEAGIIDLWAVNLMSAVLPALDRSEKSKVNCLVALLDIEDGHIRESRLLVDTTRMSVTGDAQIDLRARTIDILLTPTAKRPEFFSAATPVRVEGSFEDFGIGVGAEDLLGTIIRFVTSVIHVPIARILTPPRDPDELDVCLASLERP